MTQTLSGPQARELDRAHVEGMLARYPGIDAHELAALRTWFRKDASAHDVALVASNEDIHAAYTRFRKEHIDRLSALDLVAALLMLAVGACAIGGIVYLATV